MTDYIGDQTDNTIIGSGADDRIIGRGGNDTLTGGAGRDVFVYDGRLFGRDSITDFNPDGVDRIDVSGLRIGDFESLRPFIKQAGSDVVISFVIGDVPETIVIKSIAIGSLDAGDFIFDSSTAPRIIEGSAAWYDELTGISYPGNDVLIGGNGDDTIFGYSGIDRLVGGAGNDRLVGGFEDDTLTGGAGGDAFVYDDRWITGHDRITDFNSGEGDRIDLSGLHVGDFESLKPFLAQVGGDVVITLGLSHFPAESLSVRLVNVTIGSLDGGDFIFDTSRVPLTIHGSTDKIDLLFGGAADDKIYGHGGGDVLTGGAGDDLLAGGVEADRFFGGIGTDTVSYFDSLTPVTVDLAAGIGTRNAAEGDRFSGVENVHGGQGGDWLAGDAGANILAGDQGSDVLIGGAGNDVLRGGAGADHLIGGVGVDTASYFGSTVGVTVDVRNHFGRGGEADGDSLDGIENVHGSIRGDRLTGDDGVNLLAGFEGADVLVGGGGNDTLRGGTGADTLAGGDGADRFVIDTIADSPVGAGADEIFDLNGGQGDRIDLSLIDADRGTAGNQAFTFIGGGLYSHRAGELRFAYTSAQTTTIAGDIDGDGVSDFHIKLNGRIPVAAADFVL